MLSLSLPRYVLVKNRGCIIRLYQSRIVVANEKSTINNLIVRSSVIGISNGDNDITSSYNERSSDQSNLTPKELLYTSLASCTIMTIRTYYNNSKNINSNSTITSSLWSNGQLDEIEVQIKEDNDNNNHIPTSINLYIKFIGSLSIEQRNRLLTVANQCPVKQMIKTTIKTHLI
jgi:putative redox protein